jgi:hypothetical protein
VLPTGAFSIKDLGRAELALYYRINKEAISLIRTFGSIQGNFLVILELSKVEISKFVIT